MTFVLSVPRHTASGELKVDIKCADRKSSGRDGSYGWAVWNNEGVNQQKV